jgi:hypothetical protein
MSQDQRNQSGGQGRRGEGGAAAAGPVRPADTPFQLERERVGPLPFWGWAALTSLGVWALYVVTLAPTTAFWDASEYIATAHILGIPHPPGNPFFVMVGRTWDVLLSWTGMSVAQRINLLSATCSALASGLWFLSIARIWAHFNEDRRQVLVAAVVATLVGATAFTVWYQSNVNAKVYTVSLLFVALVTYLAMLWEDVADTTRGDRLVLVVAFLLGLGATNHQMSVLPMLALGAFVLFHRPRTLLRGRLMGAAVALLAMGFTVQVFFVPIRSGQEPLIDEADPECASLWQAAATPVEMVPLLNRAVPEGAVCEPLRAAMAREQYGETSMMDRLTDRQSPFPAQLRMYGQYFNWQWARTLPLSTRTGVTFLFALLGLLGLWRHYRGDRDSFVYFATFLFTVIPLLVYYLNFQYGYSLYPDIPMGEHEVRERDYFYILSFNIWGIYAGLGLVTAWQALAGRLGRRGGGEGRAGGATVAGADLMKAAPILGLALIPLLFNWGRADRSGDYSARDWAYNLLQSVEPYGVLFTNGDNDTFPLWYLQEVEGIRQDVTVIVHSYLGTGWYPRQLKAMTRPCEEGEDPSARPTVVVCQRPFDREGAIEAYRDMEVPPPDRSILPMSDSAIQAVPAYQPLDEAMDVPISDNVRARLDPQQLRSRYGQPLVTAGDLFVYLILRNSVGDRPVHFATTAPPVFGVWNLQPHLLRQGLAFKTVDGMLESTADTVRLSDQFPVRWLDLDRTRHLLWDVFQVEYLLSWDLWPEPSTRSSIPAQYYLSYFSLAEGLRLRDQPDLAERSYERARQFLDLGNIGGGASRSLPPE